MFAAAALDAVVVSPTDAILDLAAGTGDGALLAIQRLGPLGTVIGVDLSVPMLAVAQSKPSSRPVNFVASDAQRLPFLDRMFDSVICLFGLMFFPDARRALAEVRRVLRPDGRLAATMWATPEAAPFAGFIAQALGEALPADREELLRPFSLSDPTRVEHLLDEAGFGNIEVRREIRTAHFSSFDDYWSPVEAGGGRLGQAYLGLPTRTRTAVRRQVQERLTPLTSDGQIVMDIEAYLALGQV